MKRIKFFLSHLKNFLHSRSEKGFTLAEIMVTAGIVAVLAVAIMRMTSMSQKTARSTAENMEAAQVAAVVHGILADPASCKKSLENLVPTYGGTGVAVPMLKRRYYRQATNTWIDENIMAYGSNKCVQGTYRPGGTYPCVSGKGAGSVGIYKMALRKVENNNTDTKGIFELRLLKGKAKAEDWDALSATQKTDFMKANENAMGYGSAITVKEIPVSIILNAAGQVLSCYSTQENFIEQACLSLGGSYDAYSTPTCSIPLPTENRETCHDITLAAIGSVNYGTVAVGSSNGTCEKDEVLRGIRTTTVVGETAIVDSSPIGFTRLQLILTCCKQ